MSIVTRYFSTAAAGAGDGTSWANRAALHTGGVWSTVITQFPGFAGTDGLKCLIGPGTYTITGALANTSFTGVGGTAPTVPNPIYWHGCDSSGNPLTPPDPDWTADQPEWDDSGLPNLTVPGNIGISALGASVIGARLIKFSASGTRNGPPAGTIGVFDWCSLLQSANTSNAVLASGFGRMTNSIGVVTSTTSSTLPAVSGGNGVSIDNCRFRATSLSLVRDGVTYNGSTSPLVVSRTAIIGFGQDGFSSTSTNVGEVVHLGQLLIVGCGRDGIRFASTAAQTAVSVVNNCHISGCGGFGINAQSAAHLTATHNRLRDNTSGNLANFFNNPTDLDNYTTDSDDATEFVNAANGDYRIKNTAAIWGQGYGVSDQPAASGGLIGSGNLSGGLL